jgi:hypothetical protein
MPAVAGDRSRRVGIDVTTLTPRIQILHVPGCPRLAVLRERVARTLTELSVTVTVEQLCGSYPSPTLLIDGLDIVTGRLPEQGASCRLTLPSPEQIHAALRRGAR